MSYTIPFTTTSLGGTIFLNSNGIVTYTAPASSVGKVDSFVYAVSETGAGMDRKVVQVTIMVF